MDFEGINAKLKAMKSRLLTFEDYEEFSKIKSVAEFGARLKNHPVYGKYMGDSSETDIRRRFLERRLIMPLHDDFSKIYKFITNFEARKFLDVFFLNNEIHIIKTLLCTIYDERDIIFTMPEINALLSKKLNINFSKLIGCKTLTDFINALEGTPFYDVLSRSYGDDISLFKLEIQLDLYYYLHLWETKEKYLDKTNNKLITELVGTEIDMRNIIWVYRFKNYYELPNNLIYTFLIPIPYKVSTRELGHMAETKSVMELVGEVAAGYYGKVFTDFGLIEHSFYQRMSDLYYTTEKEHPNSLAAVYEYIFLRELEAKNLVSLLEGIRYDLQPGEIMSYLIIPRV